MEVVQRITLKDVRDANPSTIWYSFNTCWWTHLPEHLTTFRNGPPVDPRGSVLLMTKEGEASGFLSAAEKSAAHYGKHGIRAFMAAHHLNCIESSTSLRPWSGTLWQEYNEAIDRFDDKLKFITGIAEAGLEELNNEKSRG